MLTEHPAKTTYRSGAVDWRLDGMLHRLDGPAVIADGNTYWYAFGRLHREDGPAIEYSNGTKCWHLNGYVHRLDGPAVMTWYGKKEWFIHGVEFSHEDFVAYIKAKHEWIK